MNEEDKAAEPTAPDDVPQIFLRRRNSVNPLAANAVIEPPEWPDDPPRICRSFEKY